MIYSDFQGEKLSALGMGTMRLPIIDGDSSKIDIKAASAMVSYAMEYGINYYDMAWGYHEGQDEAAMGKILSAYDRKTFNVADKFPGYDLDNLTKVPEIFEEQLARTGFEYFDFYLLHNVGELNIEGYTSKELGIVDYFLEQKRSGRIRHFGFSAHANFENLKAFLDVYPGIFEFCQIQLNWYDWDFQNAKSKVELLKELQIPVWVMEPVRGGQLINLSKENLQKMQDLRPNCSAADWCMRFLQGIPEIKIVLTGASTLEQLSENISLFEQKKPLNDEEKNMLFDIAKTLMHPDSVPCTSCRYCTNYCPAELDIPRLLELYNERLNARENIHVGFIESMGIQAIDEDKRPDFCLACGSCAQVCPQNIDIPSVLEKYSEMLARR